MATTPHSGKSSRQTSGRAGKSTARRTQAGAQDAIQLLKSDHREVQKKFGDFAKASGAERKMRLAREICTALTVHTEIEEEIFYPTAREYLDDDEIVNEALVEHDAAKDLIEQIEEMSANDEMFESKMQVLNEQIDHHIQEEETKLFPPLQKSDMDMKRIGDHLASRKQELMAQIGAAH